MVYVTGMVAREINTSGEERVADVTDNGVCARVCVLISSGRRTECRAC